MSPLLDENGNDIGPMVPWEVITEQVQLAQREKEANDNMPKVIDPISQNAQTLAGASEELTAVSQAAQSTTEGAVDSQKAAAELSKMASELQQIVHQGTA